MQLGRETDDPDALLNQDGASGNPAFYQDPNIGWVERMKEWTGLEPEVVTYGTNATGYDSDCAEAILICGPGDIAQAHMADEYVISAPQEGCFLSAAPDFAVLADSCFCVVLVDGWRSNNWCGSRGFDALRAHPKTLGVSMLTGGLRPPDPPLPQNPPPLAALTHLDIFC